MTRSTPSAQWTQPARQLAADGAVLPGVDEVGDGELVRQVAGGNNRALELLFQRHAPALLQFVARTVHSDGEAEDVVQDVFIQVAHSAGSYSARGPLRSWLFSMALNRIRTHHRRAKLNERATEIMARARHNEGQHDPAHKLEQQELWGSIDKAIATLSEHERETFLLYWFGDLSYAEISQITGVGVAAAKVRVHRALSHLSQKLEGLA